MTKQNQKQSQSQNQKQEQKQNEKDNGQQKKKSITDDLFDALQSNSMLNTAQKVISSAVNVLEEEIAAGILAAKKIEKKVLNGEEARGEPDDLMNRIRRDTHEAVDIFLDALAAISKQLGFLSSTLAKQEEKIKETQTAPSAPKNNANIVAIETDEPVKPGAKVVLYMSLNDATAKSPINIELRKTDFTGPGNQKILSRYVQLKPATFELKPGEEKEIAIHVSIPKNCKPGFYTSLLTDNNNHLVRTVINIDVR